MRRPSIFSALTIATTLMSAVSGCGASTGNAASRSESGMDDFEASVADVVEDEQRRRAIHGAVDDARDVVRRAVEERRAFSRQLVELHKNYHTPREDFEALFRQNDEARRAFRAELFEFRSTLVANTTDQEWEALESVRHEALAASLAALNEVSMTRTTEEQN